MEFKFRAGDDRPAVRFPSPPPSSFGYFYDQAMRAGYSSSNAVRDVETILWREMEKDWIREEVIVEEIARRRLLETEVRREMEMRLAGRGGGEEETAREQLPLEKRFKVQGSLASHFLDCRWLEDRFAFCRSRRMVFDQLHRFLLPQDSVVQPPTTPAVKDSMEKFIVPASSSPNLCGAKRKAATSPDGVAGELRFSGLEKKHKVEWSCALCHVSVGSERVLNEHLQGRKHKAKEAVLRTRKMPKKPNTSPFPKAVNAANAELEAKAEGLSLQANESHDSTEKKEQENKNYCMSVGQNQHAKSLKKIEAEILQKEGRTLERKQREFGFWCEMCKIGTYSEVVMETHKNGKKHRTRLQGLGRNGEAAKDSKTIAEEGKERKEKDIELVAEETKEKKEKGPEVKIMEETNQGKSKETAGMYEETKEKAKDSVYITQEANEKTRIVDMAQ